MRMDVPVEDRVVILWQGQSELTAGRNKRLVFGQFLTRINQPMPAWAQRLVRDGVEHGPGSDDGD